MDVFGEHLGFWMTTEALTMHLIPCFVLIAGLVLAWKREWIGAVLYAMAGLLYVIWVMSMSRPVPFATRFLWAVCIAGPAFFIAALFLANSLKHAELHGHDAST